MMYICMHLYLYVYIYNTAVLIKICRFLINVVKFTQRVSDFLFVPLRPFFYAALTKRWRSNFVRVCVNLTTLIQKRHILMRTAVLCNGINSGQL